MNLRHLALTGLACASLAGACGDDPPIQGRPLSITAAAISSEAAVNTRLIVNALWDAQRWLDASDTLKGLSDTLLPATDSAEPTPIPAGGANFLFLPYDGDADIEKVDALVAFIEQRVFAPSTVESQTDTVVTYRLTAATTCDPSWEDEDLYSACVDTLNAIEVRLAVESYAAGDLDIAVLVGTARREALAIELHQMLAAVTVRLGPALDALAELQAATTDDPEYVAPHITASGSVRIALRRLTEDRMRIAAEIPGPVSVEVTGEAADDHFVLSSGAGSAGVDVDRAALTARLDVNLRDLEVRGPKTMLQDMSASDAAMACTEVENPDGTFEWICEEEPPVEEPAVEGTFALTLGRLAGLTELADVDSEVAVTGLIVGPLALRLDDQKVIELNHDDGATPIDLTFLAADDHADIALSHGTTLSAMLRLGLATDLWPDMADTFAASDDLTASLTGAAPSLSVGEGLMVVTGTLTLTSSARPELNKTLEAGTCGWFEDNSDEMSGGSSTPAEGGTEVPPADESSADGGHPFDFMTGTECPAAEEPSAPPSVPEG